MSAIVEIVHGIPGLTPATLYLRELGSSTVANGAGDALAEVDGEPGTYRAAVDEPLTGTHKARMVDGSGNVLYTGVVDMEDDDAVHTVGELADLPIRTRASHDQVSGLAVTLGGIVTGIAGIAAAVWSFATRRLTEPVAGGDQGSNSGALTRYRGTTWTIDLSGLGDITDRTALYFTVRRDRAAADADSLIQIEETAGLLVASGAEADPDDGAIEVLDEEHGNVRIRVSAAVTREFSESTNWYDIKRINQAGDADLPARPAPFDIAEEVTRTVDVPA